MIRLLYQVLLWLSLPAVLVRIEWRARREPEYGKRVNERLGRVPARVPAECVWFHAVSAGETIAAAPLIRELAAEFSGDGGAPFLVTAMTPAGSAQIVSRLGSAVHHCYAPYDFRFAVRSFFDRVQPRLLVLVETELWPNLIDEAHRRGVEVLLVNARLSERSAKGYRVVRGVTRRMLRQIAFVACQYGDHLDRFKALGLRDERAAVFGSVKFDAVLPDGHADQAAALRRELGLEQRPVWVAGSTHPGEEELVLDAHAQVRGSYPESCLLLVPRHPVRGDDVTKLARHRGFTVRHLRVSTPNRTGSTDSKSAFATPTPSSDRQQGSDNTAAARQARSSNRQQGKYDNPAPQRNPPQVIVCTGMGELQYLYGLSQIAFLGGSLVPVGGHNPIEAALCRQPLATGPHTHNFKEVAAAFARANCLARVRTAAQLADAVSAAFADDQARAAAGARAFQVVQQNRGATARLLELLRARIAAAAA